MGKYLSITAFIFIFIFFSIDATLAKSSDKNAIAALTQSASSWTNQEGSTMSLTFNATSSPLIYTLSGSYMNNAVGFSCRGTPYPITGRYYVNTQTLSFNVVWSNSYEDCQSVTGWTGYINISASPMTMTTNWNIAYANSSGRQMIASGSDTFTRSDTVLRSSLIADTE